MLFVGEKKSPLAIKRGWSWKDGHLAAKQLFDALEACGINPHDCQFANWFDMRNRALIRNHKGPRFAMGRVVQNAMKKAGVPFIPIVHPAARGRIRKKELYNKHIKEAVEQVT
jgi:hypothetical protein